MPRVSNSPQFPFRSLVGPASRVALCRRPPALALRLAARPSPARAGPAWPRARPAARSVASAARAAPGRRGRAAAHPRPRGRTPASSSSPRRRRAWRSGAGRRRGPCRSVRRSPPRCCFDACVTASSCCWRAPVIYHNPRLRVEIRQYAAGWRYLPLHGTALEPAGTRRNRSVLSLNRGAGDAVEEGLSVCPVLLFAWDGRVRW